MERATLRKIHRTFAILATLLIATFWSSTLISELFLSEQAVVVVKQSIIYGVFVLIIAMIATGATGAKMAGKAKHPKILAKKFRMPFIAANGLLILLPCAFYLADKASHLAFDMNFYIVQIVELVVGACNLFLMILSIRDGLSIRKPK
ncbi:hypothetical protein [Pelistega ratti]|uniref:hypothetical protein n=1 Tax=Pelistega ratti TaxID=2652177 RepID=UPI0013574CB4|nr:hypothetical protein [Pelistega ratti]